MDQMTAFPRYIPLSENPISFHESQGDPFHGFHRHLSTEENAASKTRCAMGVRCFTVSCS